MVWTTPFWTMMSLWTTCAVEFPEVTKVPVELVVNWNGWPPAEVALEPAKRVE